MTEMERESTGGSVLVDPLGGLVLDPSNELKFKGPFDDYVTVSLTIRNPTEKRIAFKIKTTAPKRYCVKPNSGVLDSQQTMKVNVLLQPFNYDPNDKNKHKFMVQYMYLNDNEMQLSVNDILNVWKDVPATRLLDIKLRCVFDTTESDHPKTQEKNDSKQSAGQTLQQQQQQQQPKQENKTQPNRIEQNSSSDFESIPTSFSTRVTNKSNSNNNNSTTRLEDNENLINELKQIKHENELLKKENSKLKEEEARLKNLALHPPSFNRAGQNGSTELLIDILQNRSSVVIIALLAIIVYLILFR